MTEQGGEIVAGTKAMSNCTYWQDTRWHNRMRRLLLSRCCMHESVCLSVLLGTIHPTKTLSCTSSPCWFCAVGEARCDAHITKHSSLCIMVTTRRVDFPVSMHRNPRQKLEKDLISQNGVIWVQWVKLDDPHLLPIFLGSDKK